MPSHLNDFQTRVAGDEPAEIAARHLDFDRHRDRVAVVFDQKTTGSWRTQAVLSDSQNSPSDEVPSPIET